MQVKVQRDVRARLAAVQRHGRCERIEQNHRLRIADVEHRDHVVRILRRASEERHHSLGRRRARRNPAGVCGARDRRGLTKVQQIGVPAGREIELPDNRPVTRILAGDVDDVRLDKAELRLGLRVDQQPAVSAPADA